MQHRTAHDTAWRTFADSAVLVLQEYYLHVLQAYAANGSACVEEVTTGVLAPFPAVSLLVELLISQLLLPAPPLTVFGYQSMLVRLVEHLGQPLAMCAPTMRSVVCALLLWCISLTSGAAQRRGANLHGAERVLSGVQGVWRVHEDTLRARARYGRLHGAPRRGAPRILCLQQRLPLAVGTLGARAAGAAAPLRFPA